MVVNVLQASSNPAPCLREDIEPPVEKHLQHFGADQLGSHGIKGSLVSPATGIMLTTYRWPATAPVKALIVAIHGHGSYATFEFLRSVGVGKPPVYRGSWVEALNSAGFAVVSMDLQSHGASEGLYGLRCYFNKFDDLVEDIVALTTYVLVAMLVATKKQNTMIITHAGSYRALRHTAPSQPSSWGSLWVGQ